MKTKIYDLCVTTRKFQENGLEKTHYENIGAMLENEEHKPFIMIKAHFNPAAIARKENSESILISCFTPKDKQDNFPRPQYTTKLYDLAVVTGSYQDNTGQKKNRYYNVGAVMVNSKSTFIMLKAHFNPCAISRKENSESILISCFPPKAKQENAYGQSQSSSSYAQPNEPQSYFAPIEEQGFNENEIPF